MIRAASPIVWEHSCWMPNSRPSEVESVTARISGRNRAPPHSWHTRLAMHMRSRFFVNSLCEVS